MGGLAFGFYLLVLVCDAFLLWSDNLQVWLQMTKRSRGMGRRFYGLKRFKQIVPKRKKEESVQITVSARNQLVDFQCFTGYRPHTHTHTS